jgi:hypothetical protein
VPGASRRPRGRWGRLTGPAPRHRGEGVHRPRRGRRGADVGARARERAVSEDLDRGREVDAAFTAIAALVGLESPWLREHSTGMAELAETAAWHMGHLAVARSDLPSGSGRGSTPLHRARLRPVAGARARRPRQRCGSSNGTSSTPGRSSRGTGLGLRTGTLLRGRVSRPAPASSRRATTPLERGSHARHLATAVLA